MKKRYGFLVATVLAIGLSVVGVNAFHKKENMRGQRPVAEEQVNVQKVSDIQKQEVWDDLDDIGREGAKAKAFAHAGIAENEAKYIEVERDYDDGRWEYSVEFKVGRKEYDYEIDAASGNVLKYDIDVDDLYED